MSARPSWPTPGTTYRRRLGSSGKKIRPQVEQQFADLSTLDLLARNTTVRRRFDVYMLLPTAPASSAELCLLGPPLERAPAKEANE